ncbi:MFS transporter [Mangrovicoccus algicola]|uniref:MFS transporter n=1 Tax=Mangrovicoccus algicola TaxID=2771008 RepID=A0A8J7CVN7_9RHOB|nr:MFS transporter [Mangrovicoccus algicola]MBE3636702.1 MFS transporter [Mangrovicoccus algicola]
MTYPDAQVRRTILALALGAFAIGVSEFASMGLLPYYARDLGVSEPVAGHAVSGYAFGVVIGAPVLAVLGARVARKRLLTLLIAFFALANAVAALAPTANTLIASRVLSGLPHGAYLGIAMLFAADILPKGKRAQGVAKVLMGLTVANIVGVPLAGAIGQGFGWRWCFVIVTLIAAASALMIRRVAPLEPADPAASPLRELGVLRNRAVWLTLLVGSVGFGGVFAVYSFFSAAMIDATDAPAWAIPLALAGFGLGATFGNELAGRLASWSRFGGALVLLIGMAAAPVAYAMVMGNWVAMTVTLLVLGATAGLVIPLQMRLMDVAADGQNLAAALNHAAFNFANAIGPLLAGLALSAGYGWAATGWVGAVLALCGIAVLGVAWAESRRGGLPGGGAAVPA